MRKAIMLLLTFLSLQLFAQQNSKPDVIFKLNGEEIKVKITEVSEAEVKYTFIGETVVYTMKTSDIFKINFASGRSQVFTKSQAPADPAPSGEPTRAAGPAMTASAAADPNSKNKIAILPFSFIRDGQRTVDELSEKVQNEVYAYMTKHAGIYTYQEPRTTTAMLIKAGITHETAKGFTMDEICRVLGVEYIMEGIVTLNHKNQSTYGSNNYNTTTKNNNKTNSSTDRKTTGSNYSTTTENFETTMLLNVYNDKGSSVFSQERKSFWNTQDSYRSAMEYLLKKTPVYAK
jgi:hypothetical protein